MLPYIEIPPLALPVPWGDALAIQPFGLLWIAGVGLGAWVSFAEGQRRGLDRERLTSLMFWMMGSAFVCGHLFDLLLYFPDRSNLVPGRLFGIWQGQSSFGGFLGALLGTLIWRLRQRVPALRYSDVIASSFPLGFGVGRLGCAIVHDHPGVRSASPFAVAFPDGPRLDMGLIEALVLLGMAIAFWWFARRPRPVGFFLSTLCIVYGVQRFVFDFWRETAEKGGDVRYWGLTPAQWLAIPLVLAGGMLVPRWRRGRLHA